MFRYIHTLLCHVCDGLNRSPVRPLSAEPVDWNPFGEDRFTGPPEDSMFEQEFDQLQRGSNSSKFNWQSSFLVQNCYGIGFRAWNLTNGHCNMASKLIKGNLKPLWESKVHIGNCQFITHFMTMWSGQLWKVLLLGWMNEECFCWRKHGKQLDKLGLNFHGPALKFCCDQSLLLEKVA